MSNALPPTPTSPGLSVRRKGLKTHPTLPLSAFTPPSTGTGEQFPLPPDPSTIHPTNVIDAHVIAPSGDLSDWFAQVDEALKGKIGGAVLSLHGAEPSAIDDLLAKVATSQTPIHAVLVPFSLEDGIPANPPKYLSDATRNPLIVLSASFTKNTPAVAEALKWALDNGFSVDIDVQTNLKDSESEWEALEELFGKAMPHETEDAPKPKGKVVLTNLLPPPDDLHLPIVKLLTHSTYQAYQSHCAALSLYSNVYVKFIPPSWGSPTPPTPAPTVTETPAESEYEIRDTNEKREWKRRIKMYIGPCLEAFGYSRIIYGSSPSPFSHSKSNAADWYELARESFAELGTEQEGVDAVFYGNAKLVYSSESS